MANEIEKRIKEKLDIGAEDGRREAPVAAPVEF